MPSALLVYAALLSAQASPPPDVQATWPAEFSVETSGSHFSQDPSYAGWQWGGDATAAWFVQRPLVDDGTPLAIQSYLQRLSRLSVSLGGAATSGSSDVSSYSYRSRSLHMSPSGLFYWGDLVLGAGFYYYRLGSDTQPADLSDEQHHTTALFYPWLSTGVRWEDFEAYASYQYRTYYDDGTKRLPMWGRASLRLRDVVDKTFSWRLDAYTLAQGGGAEFQAEGFIEPTLGVWGEATFETGEVYVNSTRKYSRQALEIGVGWWTSPRCELQFSVGVGSASQSGGNYPATTTATATFGLVVRAPQHDRPSPTSNPSPLPPVPAVTPPSPAEVPVPVELPDLAPTPAEAPPADTNDGADTNEGD